MNGHLINEELRLSGMGGNVCYDSKTDPVKVLKHCLKSGHFSVARDAVFKFTISNISRTCATQMLRHVIGTNKDQMSERYVKFTSTDYRSLYNGNHLPEKALETADNSIKMYQELLTDGVPAEIARKILPQSFLTTLVYSFTIEALAHFCEQRLCVRAEEEIQLVAKELKRVALESIEDEELRDIIGNLMQPTCDRLGYCLEQRPCPKGKILQQRGGDK